MRVPVIITALSLAMLTGCGHATSPAVGTWEGNAAFKQVNTPVQMADELAGNPLSGAAALTVNPDGTGFIKVGSLPEMPIEWKLEGHKAIMSQRTNLASAGSKSGAQPAHPSLGGIDTLQQGTFVGTMAPDFKSMTVDLGPATIRLTKQSRSTS